MTEDEMSEQVPLLRHAYSNIPIPLKSSDRDSITAAVGSMFPGRRVTISDMPLVDAVGIDEREFELYLVEGGERRTLYAFVSERADGEAPALTLEIKKRHEVVTVLLTDDKPGAIERAVERLYPGREIILTKTSFEDRGADGRDDDELEIELELMVWRGERLWSDPHEDYWQAWVLRRPAGRPAAATKAEIAAELHRDGIAHPTFDDLKRVHARLRSRRRNAGVVSITVSRDIYDDLRESVGDGEIRSTVESVLTDWIRSRADHR